MTTIHAKRLTTFSVAADGATIAIGVADEEGEAGALARATRRMLESTDDDAARDDAAGVATAA